MADRWSAPARGGSDWDMAEQTPYVHWWIKENGADAVARDFVTTRLSRETFRPDADDDPVFLKLPIPKQAANPAFIDSGGAKPPKPKLDDVRDAFSVETIGKLPKNTVLVGIVDVGIPLGHRRLRRANGRSRILASWQQTCAWGGQTYMPFGQELYAGDIEKLLRAQTDTGKLKGRLDETAFNRAARLVEPQYRYGQRDLDYRVSHGAHVLDLASGYDPDVARKTANKIRILSVNLPPQSIQGTAGNFITDFAGFAVERLIFLADALWDIQRPKKAGQGGYPLVINFSYGRQAGQKDGHAPWEQRMADLVAARSAARKVSTQIVMPTGNRNLTRGNARATLGQGPFTDPQDKTQTQLTSQVELPWFLPPSDQTSNYVEIWGKPQPPDGSVPEAQPQAFKLQIGPPGRRPLAVPTLAPGQFSDLGSYARIYCYQPAGQTRPNFVLCVAPTLKPGLATDTAEAPADLWTIRVTYVGVVPQEVTLSVQTDQSGVRDTSTGGQSYFLQNNYRTHGEDGRLGDSFDGLNDQEAYDSDGPMQRKGTQNALATWDQVFVIGSYRVSDGKPSLFSATFDGDARRGAGRAAPSLLYPGEDSPSHFGLLAAGSRDSSVVAVRGTSMSTALATRAVAEEMLRRRKAKDDTPVDETWLAAQATAPGVKTDPRKAGAGRAPQADLGRLPRRGSA